MDRPHYCSALAAALLIGCCAAGGAAAQTAAITAEMIQRAVPDGVAITSAVAVPGAVYIAGYALSPLRVANYLRALDQGVGSVKLLGLDETIACGQWHMFRVELEVAGDTTGYVAPAPVSSVRLRRPDGYVIECVVGQRKRQPHIAKINKL